MLLLSGPVFRIRKFLGLLDPDPSINKQKNFLLFCDLISLKGDTNVPAVNKKQNKLRNKLIFVCIMNATAKKSRIRIKIRMCTDPTIRMRIRIKMSPIQNIWSGLLLLRC